MCDHESFAKLQDAIIELQKADAAQSEQIKTLFHTTEQQSADIKAQSDRLMTLVNRMLMLVGAVLVIAVLALVWGGLGERGFNAVTKAAPGIAGEAVK